jgi:hypothetical protein
MPQAQEQVDVSYVRDEVRAKLEDWQMIRDCLAGQRAVKDAGSKYLPIPNADDTSNDNQLRYMQYVKRAVFYNVTRRTHAGLTALAFIDDPTIVMPDSLSKIMLDDVDGGGISLVQQMKHTLGKVASLGRCGLLADYPSVATPISRAVLQAGLGLRPIIRTYEPEDIINWRLMRIGARTVPCLIVLAETYDVIGSDGFSITQARQWRALALTPNANGAFECVGAIYRENADKSKREIAEQFTIRDLTGAAMQQIPFVAVGSLNNDLAIDDAPMLDLADLNIAHYRNSADYEESSFMCGQATPTITGMTKDWWEGVLEKKVRLGSRSAVPLGKDMDLKLVQMAPNSVPKEAMDAKERQMVALGARLIQQRDVQRTATEARIETASEMSILSTCANNTAAAYVQALGWASAFVAGAAGEITIDIHANAELERLSPADRAQLIADLQAGTLSWSEVRAKLRRDGSTSQEDDKAAAEIAARKAAQPQPPVVQAQPQQ